MDSYLSQKRNRRHVKYVAYTDVFSCYSHGDFVNDAEDACLFVQHTKACNDSVLMFDYLKYLVCTLGVSNSIHGYLTMILYALFLCSLYILILYVVGKYFFVPNTLVMARRWNMKDYEFGISFLTAFITLPVFFESWSSCSTFYGNSSLLLSEMVGKMAACFISGVAAFSMTRNYNLEPIKFITNMILIAGGSIYLFEALFYKMLNDHLPKSERASFNVYIHAVILLIIYMVFIFLIIMNMKNKSSEPKDDSISVSESLASDEYEIKSNPKQYDVDAWEIFYYSCSPYRNNVNSLPVIKLLITPIWFVCSFLIPVVSHSRPLNGWCKFQVITSFIFFPFLVFFVSNNEIFYGMIMICAIFAIITIIITDKQREPTNHELFGIFGVLSATIIYFVVDSELDNLLWQLLNYLGNWKTDSGLILSSPLAQIVIVSIFGNTLVTEGHPDMAYGLIVGVSLFLNYTSLALIVFQSCYNSKNSIAVTANTKTSFTFMLIIYALFVFGASVSNFQLRKSMGVIFIIMGGVYLIFISLSASWIVHPLGAQHSINVFHDHFHATWA